MAYSIKIKIPPSINKNLKFYIYRSKNQNDIDTIAKVKTLLPVAILDETLYNETNIEDGQYVLYDNQALSILDGINYLGPEPVAIPATEYAFEFSNKQYNEYTYSIILKLKPLPITYNGVVYYYSVIGVNDTNQMITHLSRVKAELLLSDYVTSGTRELLYCDNSTGLPTDEWIPLANPDWNTNIIFGDVDNSISYNRFGIPFLDVVPIFKDEDIKVNTKSTSAITLKIPNIWKMNNTKYNYRKLKSFKVRNIYDNKYGDFSEPTYQSLLPVSNEKMLIYRKDITETNDRLPISINDSDALVMTIVRKNGLFYQEVIHKQFGHNRYNINEQEEIAVFSESSIQDVISIEFNASLSSTYNYTFYVQDVYCKCSNPTVFIIET